MQADTELTEINPQEFQNDSDKVDFFGVYGQPDSKRKLKKSANQEKVAELLKALKNSSCWESAIMKDPHLPYYAMTAYLENKISRDQLTHIEEFYELKLTYPSTYTAPLLTPSGQFTILVQHVLNRMMTVRRSKLPRIGSDHIEKFKQLLLEFRKAHGDSALVFHFIPHDDRNRGYVGITSLTGAIHVSDIGTIVFPISVRYFFYQAIVPKNSTVAKPEGKLGRVPIDGIEKKQRELTRTSAVTHPGAFRTLNIHGYSVTQLDGTGHDAEHLGASHYFPHKLYLAVLLAVDVIRQKTGIKWSRQTWTLIDGYFIDSNACTLNDDLETAYKVDEELNEQKANLWFKKVLYTNLFTLYTILDDMQANPEKWNPYINVKNFFEKIVEHSEKEKLKEKTLDEICNSNDVQLLLMLACQLRWPVYKNTKLSSCFSIQKNEDNYLSLFIMNEPACNFDPSFLVTFAREINKEGSPIPELFEASTKGDDTKLSTLLQSKSLPTKLDPYLRIALRLAATAGHSTTTSLLLPLITSLDFHGHYIIGQIVRAGQKDILRTILQKRENYVSAALLVALKANQFEIFCFLLDEFGSEVPTAQLTELIVEGFKRDKAIYLQRILNFVLSQEVQRMFDGQDQKDFTDTILENFVPLSLRLDTFKQSLNEIMDLIPLQHPLMMKLFLAILKTGCLESLDFFVNYFITHSNQTVEDNYLLLMLYILNGLSSVKADTQGAGNLHHLLVKYQIDTFLKFSVALNQAATQNNLPRLFDLNRLIAKIFSNDCELGLHYLLNHEAIKNNPILMTHCLEAAQKIFFQNCEYEFSFSKVADKEELSAKIAEFQQFVTDGISKLELVEKIGTKKSRKKWYVLTLVNDVFNKQVVFNNRSDRLEAYLTHVLKDKAPQSHKELLDLKREVINFKKISSKETYYLRQLLAAGLKLNLALQGDSIIINGTVLLDNIASFGTRCLLWLVLAVDAVTQASPNPAIIRLALDRASEYEEFLKEITLLIHHCSIPVSLQTLKILKYSLDQNNTSQKEALEFIEERVDYLQNNSEIGCLIYSVCGARSRVIQTDTRIDDRLTAICNSGAS